MGPIPAVFSHSPNARDSDFDALVQPNPLTLLRARPSFAVAEIIPMALYESWTHGSIIGLMGFVDYQLQNPNPLDKGQFLFGLAVSSTQV